MAVLTAVVAVRRHKIARPYTIRHVAPQAVVHQQKIEVGEHLVHGHLDHLSQPTGAALPQGQESAARRVQAGQIEALLARGDAGRLGVVTLNIHQATHRLRDDIVAGIGAIGSAEAEGREGGPDQTGIQRWQPFDVDTTGRPGGQPFGTDHHIGLRCQGSKALLVLPSLQVEEDAAFIHVGMDEGEAEALPARGEKGGQVPARIRPGRLDFDHVGAKVSQNAADKGPERCCHVQDAHAVQRSRGTLMVGCCHRCSRSNVPRMQRVCAHVFFLNVYGPILFS